MGLYERTMKLAVQMKRILNGTHAQTEFTRNLEKIQFKSPEELKALQAISLCDLLNHAVENIPYYKNLKGKFKLAPETIFEDIKQFPIITKETIIEKSNELVAPGIEIIGRIETSGTLGRKSVILTDKYTETHAPDEFFNRKIGIVPGKSRILLKTARRNIAENIGDIEYEFNRIARSYLISYSYMNEARLKFMTKTWQQKRPKIIWGLTQAICSLAEYMEANNLQVPSPELVLVGGQTMLPQWKATIERIWSTKVYDRYGSVEAGNTANQCKQGDGYHYVPTVHFIEILDENLEPVSEGETGSIYITTLSKRAMPMIRYKQDDLVVYTGDVCPCCCNFPIIKDIMGKRREGIISPTFTYIHLAPVNSIITESGEIGDFQVLQTLQDSLLIRIVEKTPVNDVTLMKIKKDICTMLDYTMKITFEKVQLIKILPNGKLLRIVPINLYKEMEESQ